MRFRPGRGTTRPHSALRTQRSPISRSTGRGALTAALARLAVAGPQPGKHRIGLDAGTAVRTFLDKPAQLVELEGFDLPAADASRAARREPPR